MADQIGIPDPKADIASLTETVRLLVEKVQIMAGQRGDTLDRAATMRDLLDYQLLEATRSADGSVVDLRTSDNIVSATPGENGDDGMSVAEVYVYRRSDVAPPTPLGGSYDFSTNELNTPPDWDSTISEGTVPVWVSVTTAAVQGITGLDTNLDWSTPVRVFADGADGQAVDMIYKRANAQPTAPDPSEDTPVGWYSNVAAVPASADLMWGCVGTRADTQSNWIWQTPIQIEGQDGTSVTILGELADVGDLPVSGNTVGDGWIIAGHLWTWDGATWVDVGVIQGPTGADGLSVAEVIVYQRSATTPATPTGGSFNFGTQTLTAPVGWTSGIPAGTNPVYTSIALAVSSSPSGSANLNGLWAAPVLAFQNGVDGKAMDIIFRRSATQPATPAPSSGTPTFWFSNVNSVPAGVGVIWSSIGTRPGSTGNWTWQTPVQLEGTNGADGTDGADGALAWGAANFQMGGFGDLSFGANQVAGGNADWGEIRVVGTKLYFRDHNILTDIGEVIIGTPYEPAGSGRVTDVFYVFANRVNNANSRFGAAFGAHRFFVAEYFPTTRQWKAIDNNNTEVVFTPDTNDAVVAIGSRPSTADNGIRTLASFVTNISLDAASAPTFIQNAAINSAMISTLVADKIATGNLLVAMYLTAGNIQVSSQGFISSNKTSYGTATSGWFLGMNSGMAALDIGDGTRYLRFRPDTGLQVGGDIVATGNIQGGALSAPHSESFNDVGITIGGVETVIGDTAFLTVGDAVSANAFVTAHCTFDSGSNTDAGVELRLYANWGTGWNLQKSQQVGIRTVGGDTYFKLPTVLAHSIALVGYPSVAFRIAAATFIMTGGSQHRAVTARNVFISVMGTKR